MLFEKKSNGSAVDGVDELVVRLKQDRSVLKVIVLGLDLHREGQLTVSVIDLEPLYIAELQIQHSVLDTRSFFAKHKFISFWNDPNVLRV